MKHVPYRGAPPIIANLTSGHVPVTSSAEFQAFIAAEVVKWRKVIEETKLAKVE
jgi:tripartite-type tricarboxylate transporter receptor subunit TctC